MLIVCSLIYYCWVAGSKRYFNPVPRDSWWRPCYITSNLHRSITNNRCELWRTHGYFKFTLNKNNNKSSFLSIMLNDQADYMCVAVSVTGTTLSLKSRLYVEGGRFIYLCLRRLTLKIPPKKWRTMYLIKIRSLLYLLFFLSMANT
jgi:hypothetical protein